MSRLLSFAVVALLAGMPAYAQDRTAEIDQIFAWATPDVPGCVVAVSQHGKMVVNRAYGLADLERGVPLSTGSIFDAASIRKQFVAAAIFLLVEEGRLSLSDDVRTYIPELPDYGHTITLDHMLTHTSGLRDWVPLRNWANGSYDAMTMILRQRGLNFAPGEEWSYSNSGYVLLTEIVARTSGMSFSEFARERLFDPLGMTSTTYLDDMRLVVWNDALTNARFGEFVSEKLQEPATLNNGRKLDYARGLILDANYAGQVLWHGGGAAGYRSVLNRYPEQGLSIAILCNAGDSADNRTEFAGRIFDLFVSPTGTRPAATSGRAGAGGTAVEGLDVNSKAGLFFNERTGEPLRLIAGNGRLGVAGGGPLVAVTRDRFRNPRGSLPFMSQDEFELNFLSQDQFELKSMEGNATRYRRARPYAPTVAELTAFAGRYESDELRAVFQMTPGTDGLMVRLNDSSSRVSELAPVDRDTFQRGMMTVRFLRDEAGKVVALDFSNPVLRKITFTRVSDRTLR